MSIFYSRGLVVRHGLVYIESTMNASTDLARTLGSFPMTYSPGAERWVSRTLSVELDGVEWGVHLSLEDGRVAVYAFNDAGANVHGATTFSPTLSLLTALRNVLR